MKRWILLLLGTAMLLSGCMQSIELKERGIVQAIGVDYEDGIYTVTLQIFNPQSTGQTSFDASKLNNKVIQVQGSSISDALRRATLQNGRKMFLGNNKMIVIGRPTAQENIRLALDFFESNHETRPGTIVLVADGKADEIISAQINQGIVPANAIEMMVEQSVQDGSAVYSALLQVTQMLDSEGKAAYAALVKRGKDYAEEDAVAIQGTALFLDGKMTDTFTIEETRGFLFLKEKQENTILVVENEEVGRVSARVTDSSKKIRCTVEDGMPRFSIKLEVQGVLEEMVQKDGRGLTLEGEKAVENLLAQKVLEESQMALMKGIRSGGMDVFDFHRYLNWEDPNYWKERKEDWPDIMKTMPVNLEVSVDIERISTEGGEKH